MNIFELFTFASWTGGGVVGGLFGFGRSGIIGSAVGVPVGIAVGLAFALGCLFIVGCICKIFIGGPLFTPKSGANQTGDARDGE